MRFLRRWRRNKRIKEQQKHYQIIYDKLIEISENWSPKFAMNKSAFQRTLDIRDQLSASAVHIKSMYLAPDTDDVVKICKRIDFLIDRLKDYCDHYGGEQQARDTAQKIELEIQNILRAIMK